MYKFVFKIADVQMSNFFTLRNNAVPTRGKPYKVSLKVSQTNVRRHFFTERIAFRPIWNSLPPSVVVSEVFHYSSLVISLVCL